MKEMHMYSGIMPIPVLELLGTALVPARDGALCCLPRHCAGFKEDCGDVVPIPVASAASFIAIAIEKHK